MTPDRLAGVREQLAGLLSQVAAIDTSEKPRPDVINGADHSVPGPEWQPMKGYTVRVTDPDDLQPPSFGIVHVIWPDAQWSGDMDAVRSYEARALAMALLAAADWADGLAAGVPQLDAYRPDLPHPSRTEGTR